MTEWARLWGGCECHRTADRGAAEVKEGLHTSVIDGRSRRRLLVRTNQITRVVEFHETVVAAIRERVTGSLPKWRRPTTAELGGNVRPSSLDGALVGNMLRESKTNRHRRFRLLCWFVVASILAMCSVSAHDAAGA